MDDELKKDLEKIQAILRKILSEPEQIYDEGYVECFTCWGAGHLTNRRGEDVTCSVCNGLGKVKKEPK